MTVLTSDLIYYLSVNAGSSGGGIGATTLISGSLNNLFTSVTPDQATAGLTDYKKFFIKNNSLDVLLNTYLWISGLTTSPDDEISIALGSSLDDDGASSLAQITAANRIALISNGTDTRTVTLVGEGVTGSALAESVVLTSTTEKLSSNTFAKLYYAYVTTLDTSRIVTVKQGTGGTTLGTIGISKHSAVTYYQPTTKAVGFKLGTLASLGTQAIWVKRVVTAGADPYNLNQGALMVEGETS